MKKLFLLMILTFGLSGCGPSYHVKHSYTPPVSKDAKLCLTQCQIIKNQCKQNRLLKEQLCRNANRFYIGSGSGRKGKRNNRARFQFMHSIPLSNACYSEDTSCSAEYNTCYQTCGGKVKTEKVCVSGCNKVKK